MVGKAAFRALKQLDLTAGETLLIYGAAGSVGAIAVQLAISRGATVIGSASEDDQDYVGSLGAVAVRYGEGLIDRVKTAAPQGINAVLNTAGNDVLPVSIQLPGGPERVITLADMSAGKYGVRVSGADPADWAREAVPALVELADNGQLEIKLWRSYPLGQAATAHADIEAGNNTGKIILLP